MAQSGGVGGNVIKWQQLSTLQALVKVAQVF